MKKSLDDIKREWIAEERAAQKNPDLKRFPRPHKPKPRRKNTVITGWDFEIRPEDIKEFDCYINDAYFLFCEHKGYL